LEFDGRIRTAAVVYNVSPNSPAEHAGLQPGDEILALNGERVMSYRDAIDIIRSMQPGDRLAIDFARRINERTEAVLDGRPGQPMRTAERSIRVEREYAPVPDRDLRDRDVEVRRDYYRDDRFDRDDDLDRDWDDDRGGGRGILPWRRD
jgi:membrane-associated protease RseP (regulator of RpoE activity)